VASFDGSGDYVTVPETFTSDQNIANLTISFWFKLDAANSYSYPVSHHAGGSDWVFYTWFKNDNTLSFRVENSTKSSGTASSAFTLTSWHHAVGIYNGSQVLIYIDNILSPTQGSLTGNTITSDRKLTLGLVQEGVTANLNGLIYDVMIYDRALSAAEITAIYNAQKPAGMATNKETDLSGYASILNAIQEAINKLKQLF